MQVPTRKKTKRKKKVDKKILLGEGDENGIIQLQMNFMMACVS